MQQDDWEGDRPLIDFMPSRYLVTTFRDLYNGGWISAGLLRLAGSKLDDERSQERLREIADGALARTFDVIQLRHGQSYEFAVGEELHCCIVGGIATRMSRLDCDEAITMAKALTLEIMEALERGPIQLGHGTISMISGKWHFAL